MSSAPAEFGPTYPPMNGAAIQKARRRLLGTPIKDAPRQLVLDYANAVLSAIRSMQRAAVMRALPPDGIPNCASRTAHTEGKKILAAIAKRQAAALRAVKDLRSDSELIAAYETAMRATRIRRACLAAVEGALFDTTALTA
jgi:hypothetical protein